MILQNVLLCMETPARNNNDNNTMMKNLHCLAVDKVVLVYLYVE